MAVVPRPLKNILFWSSLRNAPDKETLFQHPIQQVFPPELPFHHSVPEIRTWIIQGPFKEFFRLLSHIESMSP